MTDFQKWVYYPSQIQYWFYRVTMYLALGVAAVSFVGALVSPAPEAKSLFALWGFVGLCSALGQWWGKCVGQNYMSSIDNGEEVAWWAMAWTVLQGVLWLLAFPVGWVLVGFSVVGMMHALDHNKTRKAAP